MLISFFERKTPKQNSAVSNLLKHQEHFDSCISFSNVAPGLLQPAEIQGPCVPRATTHLRNKSEEIKYWTHGWFWVF